MQRLRETDGTLLHRKVIRFHISKLRGGGSALHKTLRAEAQAIYDDLKLKARAHEDTVDDQIEARADSDAAEIDLENAVRDLDSDLGKLDRDNPGLNARPAIFPNGFGEVIEPEGDAQLKVLPALHVRMEPFDKETALDPARAKLSAAEDAFTKTLADENAAIATTATAFASELSARGAVRRQLESAYGRLRDLYKARPAQIEVFFMKLGRREGKEKDTKDGGEPTGSEKPANSSGASA